MTWYRRKIAVDMDTGRQYPVITGLSDFDECLYPTAFFNYFDTIPTYTIMSLYLDTLEVEDIITKPQDTDE